MLRGACGLLRLGELCLQIGPFLSQLLLKGGGVALQLVDAGVELGLDLVSIRLDLALNFGFSFRLELFDPLGNVGLGGAESLQALSLGLQLRVQLSTKLRLATGNFGIQVFFQLPFGLRQAREL